MYGTFLTNGKYSFHREDATDVASVLTKTAQLLALPFSQDILELCELRNILLTGNIPNFKFVNLQRDFMRRYFKTLCLFCISLKNEISSIKDTKKIFLRKIVQIGSL